MANPNNRLPNTPMMTPQSQPMHHPQFNQPQQAMSASHLQSMNPSTPMAQPATGPSGLTLQMPVHISPSKESAPMPIINTASLCRIGQETVQEVVQKMSEIFQAQKQLSTLPNGVSPNLPMYQERSKQKLEECLNLTSQQMRNLKTIYTKVVQNCGGPSEISELNYIPYEDDTPVRVNHSREYHYATDELREVSEQVRLRNRQLKEIIDKLRSIVWEINTMMAMRYT